MQNFCKYIARVIFTLFAWNFHSENLINSLVKEHSNFVFSSLLKQQVTVGICLWKFYYKNAWIKKKKMMEIVSIVEYFTLMFHWIREMIFNSNVVSIPTTKTYRICYNAQWIFVHTKIIASIFYSTGVSENKDTIRIWYDFLYYGKKKLVRKWLIGWFNKLIIALFAYR